MRWRRRKPKHPDHFWNHHLVERVEALENQMKRMKAHTHRIIGTGTFTDDPWFPVPRLGLSKDYEEDGS